MISGVINVYKEPGFTSHDVVAKLRGILKQKKIGHMGTLDPNAVGVLPVCLGIATKLCDILSEKDKTYKATLLLGSVTNTQDTTGEVLKQASKKELEALNEESISLHFPASKTSCVASLVEPSSIFKLHHSNLCSCHHISFF